MKYLLALLFIFFIAACSTKLSEEEYYKNAKELYSKQKFDEAIKNFDGIVEYYPEGKHNAEALFMLGYINANDVKNLDEAKKYYQEFIKKYPHNDLTDDAEYELKNLGKDVNDLPIFKDASSDSASNSPAI